MATAEEIRAHFQTVSDDDLLRGVKEAGFVVMDAEYLNRLKQLNERAGEWYTVAENSTVDICTRKRYRPAVVALMVSPEDAECIIAEHEAVPRLVDEVERLRKALGRAGDYVADEVNSCPFDLYERRMKDACSELCTESASECWAAYFILGVK